MDVTSNLTSNSTNLGLTEKNAGGCSCCASAGNETASAVVASDAVTTEVLVDGMTCSHCVSSVTEELSDIEGVENVAVDLKVGGASKVSIASAAPLDAERIRAAVEEAGYTLAGSDS